MNVQQNPGQLACRTISTWIGDIGIVCSTKGLLSIHLPGWEGSIEQLIQHHYPEAVLVDENSWILDAAKQVADYFAEKRMTFDLPLDLRVTDFQKTVLMQVKEVPFGQTATYGEIAKRIGDPGASRAVGMANNRNPIPIVIPCHRIVGAGGKLVGYAGGLEMKRQLLVFEQQVAGMVLL